MIGLSLSDCVRDMANGLVPIERVALIVTGTRSELTGLDYIIAQYRQRFWYDQPAKCEAICRELFAQGRVFEPRTYRGEAPNSGKGNWTSTVAHTFVNGQFSHLQFRLRHRRALEGLLK